MKNVNRTECTSMLIVPESFLEEMKTGLGELKKILRDTMDSERNDEWIESSKARKILGVSPRTWQNYRDRRVIPFSQHGRKIYVKRKDLSKYLEEHKIN